MNCCNDYGDCCQGNNCPVRTEMIKERNARMVKWVSDKGLGMLICTAGAVLVIAAFVGLYFVTSHTIG